MTTSEYNKTVERYADDVFRFAIKLTGNTEDAEDIVQNAFKILWENVKSVNYLKVKSYLFTIIYRQNIDQYRQNKNKTIVEFIPEIPVHHHQNLEAKQLLSLAFKYLNNKEQQLVLLKDLEGYSYEEIGNITALKEQQVKVYLHRARKKLKTVIEQLNVIPNHN